MRWGDFSHESACHFSIFQPCSVSLGPSPPTCVFHQRTPHRTRFKSWIPLIMLLCVESMKFLWCSYELLWTFQGLVDMAPFPPLFSSFSSSSSRGCDGWDCGWLWSSMVWHCLNGKPFMSSQETKRYKEHKQICQRFWEISESRSLRAIGPRRFNFLTILNCHQIAYTPQVYTGDHVRLLSCILL